MTKKRLHRIFLTIGFMLLTGCVDAERTVSTRPELPSCAEGIGVVIPALDGQSIEAVDCLISSHEAGERAEVEFTITTGDSRYRAILQTLEDGRVNYFREYPRGGWGFHLGCSQLVFPAGDAPTVESCETEYVPAGN